MPSASVIRTIHEIKQSVESSMTCRWVANLPGSNRARQRRTGHLVDGAMKIMDLLRHELPLGYIEEYRALYDVIHEYPDDWIEERFAAATDLWNYVMSVDEAMSHARVMSAATERNQPRGHCGAPRNVPATTPVSVSHWWWPVYPTPVFTPVYSGWSSLHVPVACVSSLPWNTA